jgi:hypothetical protein
LGVTPTFRLANAGLRASATPKLGHYGTFYKVGYDLAELRAGIAKLGLKVV